MIGTKKWFFLAVFSLLAFAPLQSLCANSASPEQEDEAHEARQDDRIVGGRPTLKHEYPWVVSLWRVGDKPYSFDKIFCGGSLIANKWVLTAAHCVYNKKTHNPRRYKVVFGDYKRSVEEGMEQHIKICGFKIHPQYTGEWPAYHDVALLEMCSPVTYNHAVQPIALASNNIPIDYAKSMVTVAGWGKVRESGPQYPAYTLRAVNVSTMTNQKCRKSYEFINDGQLCAGVEEGGKDACQGDSGGALWWKDESTGHIYQVGIVSSGKGCARKGYPGIYARTSYYFEWILHTMFAGSGIKLPWKTTH